MVSKVQGALPRQSLLNAAGHPYPLTNTDPPYGRTDGLVRRASYSRTSTNATSDPRRLLSRGLASTT